MYNYIYDYILNFVPMTYLKLGTGEFGCRHPRHRSIDLDATPRLELVAHPCQDRHVLIA